MVEPLSVLSSVIETWRLLHAGIVAWISRRQRHGILESTLLQFVESCKRKLENAYVPLTKGEREIFCEIHDILIQGRQLVSHLQRRASNLGAMSEKVKELEEKLETSYKKLETYLPAGASALESLGLTGDALRFWVALVPTSSQDLQHSSVPLSTFLTFLGPFLRNRYGISPPCKYSDASKRVFRSTLCKGETDMVTVEKFTALVSPFHGDLLFAIRAKLFENVAPQKSEMFVPFGPWPDVDEGKWSVFQSRAGVDVSSVVCIEDPNLCKGIVFAHESDKDVYLQVLTSSAEDEREVRSSLKDLDPKVLIDTEKPHEWPASAAASDIDHVALAVSVPCHSTLYVRAKSSAVRIKDARNTLRQFPAAIYASDVLRYNTVQFHRFRREFCARCDPSKNGSVKLMCQSLPPLKDIFGPRPRVENIGVYADVLKLSVQPSSPLYPRIVRDSHFLQPPPPIPHERRVALDMLVVADLPEVIDMLPVDNERSISRTFLVSAEYGHSTHVFRIRMDFPNEYPSRPPVACLVGGLFHPNITPFGAICLDILRDSWCPAIDAFGIRQIIQLIECPNEIDPIVPSSDAVQLLRTGQLKEYHNRCEAFIQRKWNDDTPAVEIDNLGDLFASCAVYLERLEAYLMRVASEERRTAIATVLRQHLENDCHSIDMIVEFQRVCALIFEHYGDSDFRQCVDDRFANSLSTKMKAVVKELTPLCGELSPR